MKLKFQNVFRRVSQVGNSGIVGVGGVYTDVIIRECGFTVCCGGRGSRDERSMPIHQGCYFYCWMQLDFSRWQKE